MWIIWKQWPMGDDRAFIVAGDITKEADTNIFWRELSKNMENMDVLVNNAGVIDSHNTIDLWIQNVCSTYQFTILDVPHLNDFYSKTTPEHRRPRHQNKSGAASSITGDFKKAIQMSEITKKNEKRTITGANLPVDHIQCARDKTSLLMMFIKWNDFQP